MGTLTLCLEPDEHRERCIFVAGHAGPCSQEVAADIRASLNSDATKAWAAGVVRAALEG